MSYKYSMIFEKYGMMKKLLLIFLITNNFYLITLAQQQVPEKAMGAYFRAKDYAGRTQWEEGIVELQYAIKIYPKYTQAKELLGEY